MIATLNIGENSPSSNSEQLKHLKTITIEPPMPFLEALQAMLDGKCLGIRPEKNTNYVELWRPRVSWQLRWHNTPDNQGIRTEQFFEQWRLVIIDHHTLRTN